MYEEHFWEIEHDSFTPLVFSCSGTLASIMYKHLASLVSKKSSQTYNMTVLVLSLLHLAVTCLTGSRSPIIISSFLTL